MSALTNQKTSPYLRSPENTAAIMLDVIIALMPSLAVSAYFSGVRVISVCLVSVISAVFFEWAYCRLLKRKSSVNDLSAVVTGILTAFCMPVSVPLWIPAVGSFFAIVIVKQLFGGIGKNFVNPALAARAFLFSWPAIMTTWTEAGQKLPVFSNVTDAVTTATPLSLLSDGKLPESNASTLFMGARAGCIGETAAAMLILGGIYLLYRRVISIYIPLSFLGTMALICLIFPLAGTPAEWTVNQLFSGGAILGAIFMATDYSTSPVTPLGQIVYGIGCGALTMAIRCFGAYPEGVSYAILIMNIFAWPLDSLCRTRIFGHSDRKPCPDLKGVQNNVKKS